MSERFYNEEEDDDRRRDPHYDDEEDEEDDDNNMIDDQGEDDEEDAMMADDLPTTAAELDAQLRELDNFAFERPREPDEDLTGHLAFTTTCEKLDQESFFRFPIDSVLRRIDRAEVELSHCGLGDKGVQALAECIKVNSSITKLNLTDNGITPRGGDFLLAALAGNKSIRVFNMSNNILGSRSGGVDGSSIGTSFKRVLMKNSCLTELILRGNRLSDRDVKPICEVIGESLTSITAIDLSYNELGPQAGIDIAEMIARSELKEVNLEWNQLRFPGTLAVLKDGLQSNNTIRKFNIAWNGVNDEGGDVIGNIIQSSSALEDLDCSHNRIGPKGAMAIARGIKNSSTLIRLVLAENPLKDAGCSAIVSSIRENRSLTRVDLRATSAGKVTMEEAKETLRFKNEEFKMDLPKSLFLVEGEEGGGPQTAEAA